MLLSGSQIFQSSTKVSNIIGYVFSRRDCSCEEEFFYWGGGRGHCAKQHKTSQTCLCIMYSQVEYIMYSTSQGSSTLQAVL